MWLSFIYEEEWGCIVKEQDGWAGGGIVESVDRKLLRGNTRDKGGPWLNGSNRILPEGRHHIVGG